MGWGTDFFDELAKRDMTPIIYLVTGGLWSEADGSYIPWAAGTLPPGDADFPGDVWWGSGKTGDATHSSPDFRLDPASVRLPEQRLDLNNMTYNGGTWSVEVENPYDQNIVALAAGNFCVLYMGFPGWTRSEFRRIALGCIQSVATTGARLRVVCQDLLSLLNGDRLHAPEPFGHHYVSTTLTANYTAGDTTVNVTTTTLDDYADKDGTITVVMRPGSGDAFILRASGATGTQLTGVTATGQYGTTAANMTTSDYVSNAFRLEGHPFEVLRRILVSTGAGTNGTYDEEPAEVGYAVPDELIDHDNADLWMAEVDPASGSFAIDLPIIRLADRLEIRPDNVTEGFREIHRLLAACGIVPIERQGSITIRALQDMTGSPITSGLTISWRDICEVEVDHYLQEQPQEYWVFAVNSATGSNSSSTDPPRLAVKNHTFTADASSYIWANESAVRDSIELRVAPWYTTRPERLRMTLAGSKWARLSCGDVVELNLLAGDSIYGLPVVLGRTADTYQGYDAIKGVVVGKRWLFPYPAVALEVAVLPAEGSELPDYA